MEGTEKPRRLFNRSFALLWQGQLVSAVGDVAYEIALGFWVLAATGSTAVMGALLAASTLPRVLLSPFAGVWVDRLERKRMLVLVDGIRGIAVLVVGVMALLHLLTVAVVFSVGIVIGIGAAFFNPTVNSVIPDLVEKRDLTRANSAFSSIRAGSGILGNSSGGFVYALFGAPLLFIVDAGSYLFAACSQLFIRVPQVIHERGKQRFWEDMRAGLTFTWNYTGLRILFLGAAIINFFASISFILLLPLFQRSPELGPGRYGITMAALTLGMLAGMLTVAAVRISGNVRLVVFSVSALAMAAVWAVFPQLHAFSAMLAFVFVGGVGQAVINVFIDTIVQSTVPQAMRGKVYGLLNAMSSGLAPIAMGVGGVLGQLLPIRGVMSAAFVVVFIAMPPMLLSRSFRDFVRFDVDAPPGSPPAPRPSGAPGTGAAD
jgi:MFS family permease